MILCFQLLQQPIVCLLFTKQLTPHLSVVHLSFLHLLWYLHHLLSCICIVMHFFLNQCLSVLEALFEGPFRLIVVNSFFSSHEWVLSCLCLCKDVRFLNVTAYPWRWHLCILSNPFLSLLSFFEGKIYLWWGLTLASRHRLEVFVGILVRALTYIFNWYRLLLLDPSSSLLFFLLLEIFFHGIGTSHFRLGF